MFFVDLLMFGVLECALCSPPGYCARSRGEETPRGRSTSNHRRKVGMPLPMCCCDSRSTPSKVWLRGNRCVEAAEPNIHHFGQVMREYVAHP